MLCVGGVEDRDGVAIRDPYGAPLIGLCADCSAGKNGCDEQQPDPRSMGLLMTIPNV